MLMRTLHKKRVSSENFNGQYLSKGTSFHDYSEAKNALCQDCINNRPRKVLNYKRGAIIS